MVKLSGLGFLPRQRNKVHQISFCSLKVETTDPKASSVIAQFNGITSPEERDEEETLSFHNL